VICVVHERWRPSPLAWIHRAEARSIAAELADAGLRARLLRFDGVTSSSEDLLLLRLSDPVMLEAARALTKASIRYLGPGAAAMERCYDKLEATRIARASGIDCPETWLASDALGAAFPVVLKPRCGSDSIGVRVLRRAPLPERFRSERHIVQRFVRGAEITVALLHGRIGRPLRILLPEGTPYSFARKYLVPARRRALEDEHLAAQVRSCAERIARALGVDWAGRIDFIRESGSGRLMFLECDAAPLIGAASAFAASLLAGGISRREQLRLLVDAATACAGCWWIQSQPNREGLR
jgi:D-alanine-D-alanine ligase-like ATP-grasp enzyme